MAAMIDDGITITDGGKKDVVDPDKIARGKIICRAFDQIGGIPKNLLKTRIEFCASTKAFLAITEGLTIMVS